MNKDEKVGKSKEIKGKIKETAGRVIGNPELEDSGVREARVGKAQHEFGTAKRNLGDAVEKVAKEIKK
jgi:uncharacterized protein YjbJ (UPF0337 family)